MHYHIPPTCFRLDKSEKVECQMMYYKPMNIICLYEYWTLSGIHEVIY